MKGFRAMPILLLLMANVVFLTFAPRVWFEVLVLIYRVLAPAIGRNATTYVQVLLTLAGVAAWLYAWREGFRRLHDRLSKAQTVVSEPIR